MADVLDKTTLQYIPSVNTPDYPEKDYLINPDMSAVDGVPQKYWILKDDRVVAMDAAERTAKDAAIDAEKEVSYKPCPYGHESKCAYIQS